MRCFFILGLLLGTLGCATEEKAAPPAEAPPIRKYQCQRVTRPIMLDGLLDDEAWKAAAPLVLDVAWQRRKAATQTTARLLWDDRYLYFAAELEDHDLFATIKERNGMLWEEDVFELFFKPHREQLTYYEFQVNPLNTPLELVFPSRGAGGYRRFREQASLGMQSVVKRRGTLNDPTDRDVGWTLEGRIPWKAFRATGGPPEVGEHWLFALCRYDYSRALERPELSSSAPLQKPDFHRYEDYGSLIFHGDKD
jgi:hypothetical protein